MAIRFPRMHIATSVQNRIINMASAIGPQVSELPAPAVPDATKEGAKLDQALSQPPGDMAAPAGAEEAVAAAALEGESPADALQVAGVLEGL